MFINFTKNERLTIDVGDVRYKFEVGSVLGEGGFGKVLCVRDLIKRKNRAMKIIKARDRWSAMREIEMLERIAAIDPEAKKMFVKMYNWFETPDHVFIIFEKLALSVADYLYGEDYEPLSLSQVRHIVHQLCYSVQFLHKNGITHADLKPDNMMFVCGQIDHVGDKKVLRRTEIKVIDLGLATLEHEFHPKNIGTRYYRAPEVILELEWSLPCDVWSIGCISFELYQGTVLFNCPNPTFQLASFERVLGKIPSAMVTATKTDLFVGGKLKFKKSRLNKWYSKLVPHTTQGQHFNRYFELKPLLEYMKEFERAHRKFFHLLTRALVYQPSERLTLEEALLHPFFR